MTVSTETLQWATLEAEIRDQEDEAIERGADWRAVKKARGLRRFAAGLSRPVSTPSRMRSSALNPS